MKLPFRKVEIACKEKFFLFRRSRKLVTFVPRDHVQALITGLSKQGAGVIGNYDSCSFRISGIGTFRPNSKASPYSGRRNRMSEEPEFRLEMQCNDSDLSNVISALLKIHPYEEVAYEVYEFIKREPESCGEVITLKKPMSILEIISRLNRNIQFREGAEDMLCRKIAVTEERESGELLESARIAGCDAVVILAGESKLIIKSITNNI
ncbi:MAG: hypothetical protein K1X85_06145 [Ignavibacteria bacterium]|nr:hypothetical protein [Ignavibacteria bacterium]